MGAPALTDCGAVNTATGTVWMLTVIVAGWLTTPRLSVTTSEKVTCPD